MHKIAIIGGSGLEDPSMLQHPVEVELHTPYGHPSSTFKTGKIGDTEVVILSRHGRNHSIPPSRVNNRANIWAIRELGCTHILSTTACGSLRENIKRGDMLFPDQFIDFTRHRDVTFHDKFEKGKLNHTAMADPFDQTLREFLISNAKKLGIDFHPSGTVLTIEGPRFSTRAESVMFRLWGADVINMSVAPECILANELKIPYATVAVSTDYDCWKTEEQPVTWEEVLDVFNKNVEKVKTLLYNTITSLKQTNIN
ncbi:MAG: S-methyl-5'-thioadenosine phosphorylase [Prolixibacteraceae bacterium]|jgi:5'-methylthioadenosine phosphorylase|nr:S-methyl-5'-thioadenosine phosphorylase [Prolixibacteraceae bacterium]MDD4757064.1 S-methyl-5'-thioadenosine phosphorylase [Prolixibacteraceae bacterium]